MKSKTFFIVNILGILGSLLIIALLIVIIDPYFHYHKPLKAISYIFNDERYINNGIVKHFNYDAVITGTSMVENFKTSQFDKEFDTNSIKVAFSGGTFKEVNDILKVAFENNPEIKYVLRGLDYGKINMKFDETRYDQSLYPKYLYDKNLLNDYKYWWNKEILIKGIIFNLIRTIKQEPSMTFDEYAYWDKDYIPGKSTVLYEYKRPEKITKKQNITMEEYEQIDKNIEENIVRVCKQHPDTKFILFITPYSIVYWDELNQKNEIEKQIKIEEYLIKKLLEISNIELYSFYNNYGLITNLNNYRDPGHYMGKINEKIIQWIKEKKYRITKDNYRDYLKGNLEFYNNYNYESIFVKN